MDEAGDEAIMLYLEQETIIPANTMRVCKVTSRNLRAHEGRLFWLRSMTNEIKLVAAQAMAPVDKGALWVPIYNAEDTERTISKKTHIATAEKVIIMAPEVMRQQLNHEAFHRGRLKQRQRAQEAQQYMTAVAEVNRVEHSETQVSNLELDSNFPEVCNRLKRSGSAPAILQEGEFAQIDKNQLPPPGPLP